MKHILIVPLLVISIQLTSQVLTMNSVQTKVTENKVLTNDTYDSIIETTTLVVIDDNHSESGEALLAAIENLWKITPYKIIESKDLEDYLNDPEYSIITPYITSYEGSKNPNSYKLGFAVCKPTYSEFKNIDWIYSKELPSVYQDGTHYLKEYAHLTSFYVRNILLSIDNLNKGIPNPSYDGQKMMRNSYTETGYEKIKNSIIMVSEDDLSVEFDRHKFEKQMSKNLKNLNQKIKFVSRERLKEAIDSKEEDVVFFLDIDESISRKIPGGRGKMYAADSTELLGYVHSYNKTSHYLRSAGIFVVTGAVSFGYLAIRRSKSNN